MKFFRQPVANLYTVSTSDITIHLLCKWQDFYFYYKLVELLIHKTISPTPAAPLQIQIYKSMPPTGSLNLVRQSL
jgi:hypothetical protein